MVDGTMIGPLINARQRDRVLGYVQKGIDEGGTVVTGGGRPAAFDKGYYVEPTLVVGVDNSTAIARVRRSSAPCSSSFRTTTSTTRSRSPTTRPTGCRARCTARATNKRSRSRGKLRTGTVSVNGGMWYGPDVPFGGYRQSGVGRESGREGFEEYLEIKSVAWPA